ncbi:MAG TPA: aminotransferase class V-fold PLP-dependent enzyme, partial [Thermodesulfobacteriota bacterium]|nr:aminotransferase class V-fold PLP-dependent enzyme [Thermodesulfobacteriota bacterium]
MLTMDLSPLRRQFPALGVVEAGRTPVFFDGPGGTQVPQRVIDAVSHYLAFTNANHGGPFRTSRESDALLESAHRAMADFLNAPSARGIVMGPNMTTLTFQFSRSIGQRLTAGDEIIITRLDHDANRAPWQSLTERGVIIREVDFDPADCTLRMDELADCLNRRTRIVAVGYASNIAGTVNPIPEIAAMAHSVGAWL